MQIYQETMNTHTMGPGGPLGPDDPSFPGGPCVETTFSQMWVTTHRGPHSRSASVSRLHAGFSLESDFFKIRSIDSSC